MRILAIFGVLMLGVMLVLAGAAGALWYTRQQVGPGDGAASAAAVAAPAVPAASAGDARASGRRRDISDEVGLDKVRSLLSVLDEERRNAILGSEERFREFVRNEAANQSVLTAAYANRADQREAVRLLMERAADTILVEAYLNEIVKLNADPGFPAEADIEAFYERNEALFRLPERVHLWQIFVAVPAEAPADVVRKTRTEVVQLVDSLRKGRAEFAATARSRSGHAPSRLNDGYMGLLRVDELLPEVGAAVAKLKPGAISDPVRTAAGFHILRRGAVVPGSVLELAEVTGQIRQRLRQQAAQRIRQGALDKIVATYPVRVPDAELEAWRQALSPDAPERPTETPDAAAAPPAEPLPLAN